MKYILLMYSEECAWPPEEHRKALQESVEICHQLIRLTRCLLTAVLVVPFVSLGCAPASPGKGSPCKPILRIVN